MLWGADAARLPAGDFARGWRYIGLFLRGMVPPDTRVVAEVVEATVLTMYLLPAVNLQLRPRILELRAGTRVVSHDWDMGEWRPDAEAVPDKARPEAVEKAGHAVVTTGATRDRYLDQTEVDGEVIVNGHAGAGLDPVKPGKATDGPA